MSCKKVYEPIKQDRCNHCPLFVYWNDNKFCRFDYQETKYASKETGEIYRPQHGCRVKKIIIQEVEHDG